MSDGFELHDVGVRYGAAQVLSGVTLRLRFGQLVTVAGPNGAGKSTLLGVLSRLNRNFSGTCWYEGRAVAEWPPDQFARQVAYVPQSLRAEFPFSAEEVVLTGRSPHLRGMFESQHDRELAAGKMALTDSSHLAGRDFRTLSGGEKQRIILAAALAQEPRVLLLDEPTSSLDLSHQIELYSLLDKLCRGGMMVISVTHDLNLAAMFEGRIILLREGRLAADGTSSDVLRPETISNVFGVRSEQHHLANGRSWITYGY